jgi:hypothetical protein
MKTKTYPILAIILAGMITTGTSFCQFTGREIIQLVKDQPDGDNRKSVMTMTLINKRGSKRERTMLSYAQDYGKDSKSIMFFKAPADVRGTGFLTWNYDNPDNDDDRWLYLPAMKKTRRISGSSARKEYFMGSDFTYDDMGGRNVDEDEHTLMGEEQLEGRQCWIIKSIPKEDDAIYSKTISWIWKDALKAVRIEFYDRMGELQKTLTITDLQKTGDFWTVYAMEMQNHQRNHQTLISIQQMEYDISIPDNHFTVASLERGNIE